jgi:hypothetical protein
MSSGNDVDSPMEKGVTAIARIVPEMVKDLEAGLRFIAVTPTFNA